MLPENDPCGQPERSSNDQNRFTYEKKSINDRYHYQPDSDGTSNSNTSGFNSSFAQRIQPNPHTQRNSRPYYQNNGYNKFNYSYNNNSSNGGSNYSYNNNNNYRHNNNNNNNNYEYNNNNNNLANNYGSNSNFAIRGNPSQKYDKTKANPIKIERPQSTPLIQADGIQRKSSSNISIAKTPSQQIKIEPSNRIVTHSLSDEIKSSSKSEPKIKIQKASQENKGFIISSGDAKSEFCPFCGTISLPFSDLLNHIIVTHKLTTIFEDTFRSSKNPECCSKCNTKIEDNQLLKHCLEKHHQSFFEMIRDKCLSQFESRRSEIEVFIEKHEPNINPRYSRSIEISSSNSSDNEEDSFSIDEDYERFAASSIDTSGLATEKTVKKVDPKFDPSKIEISKKEAKAESTKNVVSLFADYEIFLRNYNLFQQISSTTFLCNLCQKKFDSVIRLVDHSLQQHRLRISAEIRKALCMMKKNVTYDMDEKDLMKMVGLNLDLALKNIPRINVKDTKPAYTLDDVPQVLVDMMLETLSFTQPVVNARHTPKIFKNTTSVMVRLPIPLPVLFTSDSSGTLQLGFINAGPLDGERIRNIVNDMLSSFMNHKIIDAYFKNMDNNCGFTDDDLNDMIEELDVQLLKADDHINADGTRSFSIAIMIPKWSKSTKFDIERELKRLFEEAKMTTCKKCHEPFNINNDNTECEGPKANGLTIKVKGKRHEPDKVISEYELNDINLGDWHPEKRYTS